jgi:DNA-binding XRE family transcriptional regulator
MLAVVKTPHIKIQSKGNIPKRILDALKKEYGTEVRLVLEPEDEKVDVFETDWYKGIKEKLSPGKNLRIYRQNAEMTLQKLGELLGNIPRQHISNMEKGTRPISKKTALKLAQIFDVSVEKFIG